MNSTPCFTQTPIQSDTRSAHPDLDACIARAWLDLVALNLDCLEGDDWLPLCDDIEAGEIYREWFLWYDSEVSQEWEAYDPLTNARLVSPNRDKLLTKIDLIENARQHRTEEVLLHSVA